MTKTTALTVSALASFLMSFIGSAVNVALPAIGKDFSIDAVLMSWIVTSYFLAGAMFLLPFGKVADIYGRKKVFTLGVLLFTLASFLSAVAPSAILLIFFRILQGIGCAMISGTGIAILTSVFPVGERGKALGMNVAAIYLGLTLGPILGGFLTQHTGWRSIFWLNVPFGIFIVILILLKLKGEWAEAKGEKLDIVGSVIYGLSLALILYGFSVLTSTLGIYLILIGIFLAGLFIWWEVKVDNPIFDIRRFKSNTTFLFSNLAALTTYTSTFSAVFLLSLYLQYIKGVSPQHTGLILAAQPIVMTIFSPFAGRLSDSLEPRIIASWGIGLIGLSLFLFTFLSKNTSIRFVVADSILFGLGFAIFASPNTNAIMNSVEKKFYGVASAIRGTMRMLGQTLSMGIVMLVLAIYIGRTQITPMNYSHFLHSIRVAFTVFTLLCFVGVIFSFAKKFK